MNITLSDVIMPEINEAVQLLDLRIYSTDSKFLGLATKDDKIQIDVMRNDDSLYDVSIYFIYMNYHENVHREEINKLIIDTINAVKA